MSRLLALSLLAGLLASSTGCAMCCAPSDYNYPAFTGRWVRNNPATGRVGSAFDEAGSPADVVPVAATAQPTNAPPGIPLTPSSRPVLPRNLGETYLPRGP
jgi:hypothetical protein